MPRVGLQALVLRGALDLIRLPLVELDVQEVLVVVLVAHRRILEDLRERLADVKTPSRRRGLEDAMVLSDTPHGPDAAAQTRRKPPATSSDGHESFE